MDRKEYIEQKLALGIPLTESERDELREIQEDVSRTIKADTHPAGIICGYRIRKLTPKECWRLMDFDDADVDRASEVVSNSQLYKQAGNSIVVNVLTAIFGQIFEGKETVYQNRSKSGR